MELEQMADNVLAAWQERRLRLWLTSLGDQPEAFGQWSGLVRLRAQFFTEQWRPDPAELIRRLRKSDEGPVDPQPATGVLLPMAADALEADLLDKGVPRSLAQRARDLFTLAPPVAQWKF